jgi:osmotically-inducible protein OsmY
MTDRNRYDEQRSWRNSGDWRADEEQDYRNRGSSGGGNSERQAWQQDYSGEFGRHGDHDRRNPARPDRIDTYRSGSASQHDQSYGQQHYGQQQGGGYDDRSEFQTSNRRYSGTGYSSYGTGPQGPTGDYFGTGDFGSGAHAWDRNSARGHAGELGSMSSYSPGSGDRGGARQSWQREYGGSQERGFLERAGDEVMSWFGDEDAARRREADHRGMGPSDYTRSDERIREDANDRLTDDPRVNARNVSVSVENGEVTLSGTVSSREDKRRAEDCVDAISGVKHVQNNLRVDAASGNSTGSYSNWDSGSTSSERKATGMTTGSDKNAGTAGAATLRSGSATGSTSTGSTSA